MKMTWKNPSKNKSNKLPISELRHLPFEEDEDFTAARSSKKEGIVGNDDVQVDAAVVSSDENIDAKKLSEMYEVEGNKLAEDGNFREALGKWEASLTLNPERAILHEQKAQVLLELGEAWNALKAATRATELEATWAEAWITLGRTQLNFGEPDTAIESFDRALAIKPDSAEARDDRGTALHLVKKRKQLHRTGLSSNENRFAVVEGGDHP